MNGKGVALRDRRKGYEIGTKRQFLVQAGQLLLSKIDARNGAFGIVPNEAENAIITGNFWAFEIQKARVVADFLNLLTKSSLFLDFCIRASEGTTNRLYLQEDRFLSQPIKLPPIDEQYRIMARINATVGKVSDARALRAQARDEVEQLCRSILVSDTEAAPITMRELLRFRQPDVIVQRDEKYNFAGVYSFGRGVFRGNTKLGTEFAYSRLTRLHIGNFVYPKLMAWEGALGVVPPECDGCVVSPEFPVFEVIQERVLPIVLDVYFRNPAVWPDISGASTGTNVRRRRLHPSAFLEYQMPLPTKRVQRKLLEMQPSLDALKRLQAETDAELDALMPSILDKAFRGEL
jgi:type I restriction enzyme S subunit